MDESGNHQPHQDSTSRETRAPRRDLSALRMDPEDLEERHGSWLTWLVLALVISAAAWAIWRFAPRSFLQTEVNVATVRQVTPTERSTVLTASGYTYARDRAAVGAKVIGRILELPVEEGDTLRAGDLIAVLDSADLQSAVAQGEAAKLEVEARRADAARNVARQTRLVEEGIVAQSELDAALTAHEVIQAQIGLAEARLASSRAQLAYTRIYAPINGVVIEKNVEVGEMVAPGGFTSQQSTGAILRMADPASLEIEADINESYIARLERGQRASISVDAVPDRSYRGTLRQIVPTADRQRAVVQVKVSLDERDARLVPDMSCTVTFLDEEAPDETDAPAEPTLYVPQSAVREATGGDQVWVFIDDQLRRRRVSLGDSVGDERVVLEGLSAGEQVVLEHADDLEEGQHVRLAK